MRMGHLPGKRRMSDRTAVKRKRFLSPSRRVHYCQVFRKQNNNFWQGFAMFSMLTLVASVTLGQAERRDREAFCELKIRPVLAGTFFKCHGGKKVSNGLRVDSRAALLEGG